MGLLNALFRMGQQWQFHRRWFCRDKPDRIRNGYTPDGLYPHERSEGDKERLGQKPFEPKSCQWKGGTYAKV